MRFLMVPRLSGGNEVRFQNKGLEPIDLVSGKRSFELGNRGFFLLLTPNPFFADPDNTFLLSLPSNSQVDPEFWFSSFVKKHRLIFLVLKKGDIGFKDYTDIREYW